MKERESKVCDRKTKSGNWAANTEEGREAYKQGAIASYILILPHTNSHHKVKDSSVLCWVLSPHSKSDTVANLLYSTISKSYYGKKVGVT